MTYTRDDDKLHFCNTAPYLGVELRDGYNKGTVLGDPLEGLVHALDNIIINTGNFTYY